MMSFRRDPIRSLVIPTAAPRRPDFVLSVLISFCCAGQETRAEFSEPLLMETGRISNPGAAATILLPTIAPRRARFSLFRSCFPPGARIRVWGLSSTTTRQRPERPARAAPRRRPPGGWRPFLIATAIGSVTHGPNCASTRVSGPGSSASDVLQEAFLDVAHDLDAYLADPKLPPLLWLRLHVGRRLTTLHRQHLGTKMRDAGMEISLYRDALPEASSAA